MSFFWKRARALAQVSCTVSLFSLLGQAAQAQNIAATSGNLSPAARANFEAQFKALQAEKNSLTPAQRKLSTSIAFSLPLKQESVSRKFKAFRGLTAPVGKIDVTIVAPVSSSLLSAITAAGGTVVSAIPGTKAVRALLTPAAAEQLAARADVRYIRPFIPATTRVGPKTTEGDVAHAASFVRDLFKVAGRGIKIGVLSDGVVSLKNSQSEGELPDKVTIIRNGKGAVQNGSGDEGTAMLEIVHDIAPEAELFFASASGGQEVFADNIRRLRAAGCDIIVDDIFYANEGVFQDDVVAQAVTEVVEDGALYFAAAGNDGNLVSGTAGTWEGQFRSGGSLSTDKGLARYHSFNGDQSNVVEDALRSTAFLQWADPLGDSTNDYDLYVVDSTGAIVDASQDDQATTGAPFESLRCDTGDQLVVTLSSGQPRPIHLQVLAGVLRQGTTGSVFSHSATAAAIGVAAVPATRATEPFNKRDVVEVFSSDGFRTYYFDAEGKKKTYVVKTPQIAAADGIETSVPGFTRFFGTSAAAPHAAALAALVWSQNLKQKSSDVREALYSTAIDIMASGFDKNSGHGIIMADRALAKVGPPVLSLPVSAVRANEGNAGNKSLKLTVKLSKKSDTDITLGYTTKGVTAKADSDFVQKTGTVTIPKGATSVDVFVAVIGDKIIEENETFTVTFSRNKVPFNGTNVITVTIADDDKPTTPTQPSENEA